MKAKIITQKALSLLLAAVMVLALIPASVLSVFATEAQTINLSNYDGDTQFVVNNKADWDAVFNSGKNFDGKTIELGANISGVTFRLTTDFAGTFDGNGQCISNLKFEIYDGAVGEWGLFKTISSNGVVKNLTIKNCTAKYLAPDMGYAVSNVIWFFSDV